MKISKGSVISAILLVVVSLAAMRLQTRPKAKFIKSYLFADLFEQIKKQKISQIEDLIPKLPPEFLHNYTLIKNSVSLQESSASHPRAILFGETGELILTFNGSNQHLGYGAVETAEFDSFSKRILFREILFKKDLQQQIKKTESDLKESEIEFENDFVIVSKPNPQKCLTCHTDSPSRFNQGKGSSSLAKYIWNPYRRWSGAFGENDDFQDSNDPDFLKYREVASAHPRYQPLNTKSLSPSFPYNEVDPKSPFDDQTKDRRNVGLMPNARLLILLDMQYAQQVAQVVTSHPFWPFIQRSFISYVLKCEDVKDLKADFAKALKLNPQLKSEVDANLALARKFKFIGDSDKDFQKRIFAAMGWTHQFNLKLNSNDDFISGILQPLFSTTGHLEEVILQAIVDTDSQVKSYLQLSYDQHKGENKLSIYRYGLSLRTIRAMDKGYLYLDYAFPESQAEVCQALKN